MMSVVPYLGPLGHALVAKRSQPLIPGQTSMESMLHVQNAELISRCCLGVMESSLLFVHCV